MHSPDNYLFILFSQVETHFDEEREAIQSELLMEYAKLLDKYRHTEVGQ